MALKELLVHLNQAEGVDNRLRLAAHLAIQHGSHLTGLFVNEWNDVQVATRATAEMGLADARALETLDRTVTAEIDRAASRLRHTLEDARTRGGLDATWHQVRGFCEITLQRFLPGTDLCVLGHEGLSAEAPSDSGLCESLLMSAGTPLLFIPKSAAVAALATRIVVAWDSSRAATRALNDAIALIEKADQAWVLNVEPGRDQPPADSLQRVAERLARHCPSVDFMQLRAPGKSVAEVIHGRALELDANLIVCGAFGHSRLKENLFGGVTRELLDQTKLPLLLSH